MSAMDARELDRIRSAAPKRARADIITIITYSKFFCKTNVVTPQWIHYSTCLDIIHTHAKPSSREVSAIHPIAAGDPPKKAAY